MSRDGRPRDCRSIPASRKQIDNRDLRVARMAAQQWGVLSAHELYACGLGPNAIAVRVRHGHLHRVYRGVYAIGHTALTLEGRLLAAVKACGQGAVLSHLTAAILWGLIDPFDRLIDVTIPGTSARRQPGVLVHRTLLLDPGETTRHRGIPVTTPLKTLRDCTRQTTNHGLTRLVRRAQALHLVDVRRLAASSRLAAIAATGPAPTRSELEDVVLDAILGGGFEHPDVNRPLRIAGRRIVPDFRWPAQRLILEADGAAWHDPVLDAERQALLEAHGERVLRTDWHQAVGDRARLLARLSAAGAPRCRP